MTTTDTITHSWVDEANEPDATFPIQSLPWGAFRRRGSSERPRLGVPIGGQILEIKKCVENGLLHGLSVEVGEALCRSTLNDLMALGPDAWRAARWAITELLQVDCPRLRDSARWRKRAMIALEDAELLLPVDIGDYTDFYASIDHATNVGSMFRPDNPLMPNYRNLPVGYHGRASSIVVSGTPIRRPNGQTRPKDDAPPVFGPSRGLDYELEVGFLVGPGNPMGDRISVDEAPTHIFGMLLVNDWSARDIQKWEYQPLGPFNAKNFGTSVSPWVVPMDALRPFHVPPRPRGADDPPLLDYLTGSSDFTIDLRLEVLIASEGMREKGIEPTRISTGNFRDMYWTMAQMLAHHTSTGCNMHAGDLLASGTVSGPGEDARGCLLERTWRGEHPVELGDGTTRAFLQDGDEVIIRGWCEAEGARTISFGECRGIVTPAE